MSPTASRTLGANFGTAPVYVGPSSYSSRSQITLATPKYYYDAVAELIGGIDLRDRGPAFRPPGIQAGAIRLPAEHTACL
jgi:hypothetical protein